MVGIIGAFKGIIGAFEGNFGALWNRITGEILSIIYLSLAMPTLDVNGVEN